MPQQPGAAATPTSKARPKPLLRRILRWLIRALLALLAFGLLYALAVWILGAIPVNSGYKPATTGIDIMITSNGVHTDFYLPTKTLEKDWSSFAPLQSTPSYLANSRYVLIGWGDRGFFLDTPTWDDLTVGAALSAVFLPTTSVMHVYYSSGMATPDEQAVQLRLSSEEYRRFVAHIESGFRLDADGKPVLIRGQAYSDNDVFYEGVGSYHLFNTCNNWASRALDAAGVTTPVWSPFDGAIFSHLPR